MAATTKVEPTPARAGGGVVQLMVWSALTLVVDCDTDAAGPVVASPGWSAVIVHSPTPVTVAVSPSTVHVPDAVYTTARPDDEVAESEVQKERRRYEDQLGRTVPGGSLTASQVRVLVNELRSITTVLADADLSDKAELYAELGVNLSYHQDGTVAVEALPRGVVVGVGGGT